MKINFERYVNLKFFTQGSVLKLFTETVLLQLKVTNITKEQVHIKCTNYFVHGCTSNCA